MDGPPTPLFGGRRPIDHTVGSQLSATIPPPGHRLVGEYLVPFVQGYCRPASTISGSFSHSVAKAAKVSWRSTLYGIT